MTIYRQVGWAQIEKRRHRVTGLEFEVIGSVSDERTEHHTEPVYIAVRDHYHKGLSAKNCPVCQIQTVGNIENQDFLEKHPSERKGCIA